MELEGTTLKFTLSIPWGLVDACVLLEQADNAGFRKPDLAFGPGTTVLRLLHTQRVLYIENQLFEYFKLFRTQITN